MNDTTEVYAVPGKNNIIDTINPTTGLTSIFGHTEAEVKAQDPEAVRTTWEAWRAAAIERQQTPILWRHTTREHYHEMLEVLPPALWIGGAFAVGEPMDHCFQTGQPRFECYIHSAGRYYVSSRPMTCAELRGWV